MKRPEFVSFVSAGCGLPVLLSHSCHTAAQRAVPNGRKRRTDAGFRTSQFLGIGGSIPPPTAISHNGEGHHVGNFSTSWGRALGRAKVAFAFHDLRRTAVRNMTRAGVPERVAMEISSHQTRALFDRYNIVSGRDLDDAMAKRTVYEAEISKAKAGANGSREPVPFPSATPLATQVTGSPPAGAWAEQPAAYNFGQGVPEGRLSAWPIRGLGAARRGRHGRGVPGARHAARAHRRDQGPA